VKKAVCVISGGMDSALATAIAKDRGYNIIAVHFNYGQRTQERELEAFRLLTKTFKAIKSYEIELPFFTQIGASALTDRTIDVPTRGIKPGVPITYVPFRNGIFLSIATAIAEREDAESIYIGVVEEDSSGYPDCRENYMVAMKKAINLGTKDTTDIKIETPLIDMKKSQIVREAIRMGVKLEFTWSCYQNEDEACGVCDSCRLRLRGFEESGFEDPIIYRE
jgi:7-cyano-7-deazaguanine synthase